MLCSDSSRQPNCALPEKIQGIFQCLPNGYGAKGDFKTMDVPRGTSKPIDENHQSGLGNHSFTWAISELSCHLGSGRKTIGKDNQFSNGNDRAERREISGVDVGRGHKLGAKCESSRGKSKSSAWNS